MEPYQTLQYAAAGIAAIMRFDEAQRSAQSKELWLSRSVRQTQTENTVIGRSRPASLATGWSRLAHAPGGFPAWSSTRRYVEMPCLCCRVRLRAGVFFACLPQVQECTTPRKTTAVKTLRRTSIQMRRGVNPAT